MRKLRFTPSSLHRSSLPPQHRRFSLENFVMDRASSCSAPSGIIGWSVELAVPIKSVGARYFGMFAITTCAYIQMPILVAWVSNYMRGNAKIAFATGFMVGLRNYGDLVSSNVVVTTKTSRCRTGLALGLLWRLWDSQLPRRWRFCRLFRTGGDGLESKMRSWKRQTRLWGSWVRTILNLGIFSEKTINEREQLLWFNFRCREPSTKRPDTPSQMWT